MGASTDDVPALSSLDRVVRAIDTTLMHFRSGWSGTTQGFGHEGYYTGDDHYGHVDHQQGKKALEQENRTMRFPRKQQQYLVTS
jgi:hypothetical protein